MDQEMADDFASDSFFDANSLQQQIQHIDAGAGLDAAVANVPVTPPPAVVEQLSKKWHSGCLERIAWSRHGHLASISEDGNSVYLECLQYDHGSKSWHIHDRHTLTTVFEDAVTLAWSASGGELAVLDLRGRIWIYHTALAAINRMMLVRQGNSDEGDQYAQPVGMTWLSQDRQDRARNVVTHASKNDLRWQHENAKAKPLGPNWPRAMAVVHRNGLFALCFQRRDGQYLRITEQLSPQDGVMFTHAALASTLEGKMLIALHSYTKIISAYLVAIDWTEVNQKIEGQPTLTIESITSQVNSQPTSSAAVPDSYEPDSWWLSHLKIVQLAELEVAGVVSQNTIGTPPSILAVSTGINRTVNVPEGGFLVSSTIKRWTVTGVETKLHPLFDALPSNDGASTVSKAIYTVQEQPEKAEQVITTMHHADSMQSLVVTTLENRTDFLSFEDMSPLSYAASVLDTACMSQSGFAFPYTQTVLSPAFSPGACVRADIATDGKTQLSTMEYQLEQTDSQQPLDPHVDVAIASLNLTFARACWSNAAIDDILMCASRTVPSELVPTIISSIYRTLFRDNEFVHEKTPGSDLERIFHKQVMIKVFSYHASLAANCADLPSAGFTAGRAAGWSLSAQWAWMANNVRHTTTFLFMNLRDTANASIAASQDFTDMLCANIRWGLSLIRLIFNTILDVGDRETNPEMFDEKCRGLLGDTNGDGTRGLVALLLNCHASRLYMIAFVRAVRTYAKITEPKSQHQLQVVQCIQQHTMSKGLTFPAIEALLEYRWSAVGDVEGDMSATAARQIDMMATGIVHEAYQPTIKNILNKLINSVQGLRANNLIDRLKLFVDHVDLEYIFVNQDILGRPSERNGYANGMKDTIYDIYRKRAITTGVAEPGGSGELLVRRCVRCGSYSEDVVVPPKELPRQVALLFTRCVCDGNWVLEPWSSIGK